MTLPLLSLPLPQIVDVLAQTEEDTGGFSIDPTPVRPDGWEDVETLLNLAMYVLYGMAGAGLLIIGGLWLWGATKGHGSDNDFGRLGKWALGMMLIGGAGGITTQLAAG